MTHMTEKVRETFATVSSEVPVPAFDEVAFRTRVRRARHRRTGRAVLVGGVAAAVVSAALLTVPPLLDGEHGGDRQVAGRNLTLQPGALREPVYWTAGSQLVAATPDGEVHDLGPVQSVVGSTAEGVLVTTLDSELLWVAASASGEGDGTFTFAPGEGPVTLPRTGPVRSAALSADGRWLAWVDRKDVVTVYDLKAQAKVHHIETDPNSVVTAVSDRGALVSVDGELTLFGATSTVDIPTEGDGHGVVSDLAGDLVTVADRDDVTRIYDVSGDTAKLVDSVPGTGRLAAYARGVVSVSPSASVDADGETAEVVRWMADGEPETLQGIGGTPQAAVWLDEDHALVAAAEGSGTVVYVCPVSDASCTPVGYSDTDLRLAD